MTSTQAFCRHCKYAVSNALGTHLLCQRFPPVYSGVGNGDAIHHFIYPVTRPEAGCGEFIASVVADSRAKIDAKQPVKTRKQDINPTPDLLGVANA